MQDRAAGGWRARRARAQIAGDEALRFRFQMPSQEQRVQLEETVANCRLFYLDVYDVPRSSYSSLSASR